MAYTEENKSLMKEYVLNGEGIIGKTVQLSESLEGRVINLKGDRFFPTAVVGLNKSDDYPGKPQTEQIPYNRFIHYDIKQ